VTVSCPLPILGVIRNAHQDAGATPVQAALNPDEQALVDLDPQYTAGLAGIEGFDYIWLLTWLADPLGDALGDALADAPGDAPGFAPDPPPLTQVPFLLGPQGRSMGVFATRGPRRVNPIGLSLVRLLDIDGKVITFAGVDMIDGTPVIDIKPYVTRFDRPAGDPRCGWFDTLAMAEAVTPDDLAKPEA
jgi:tRNA (adenine37-N6)-methyltransferase